LFSLLFTFKDKKYDWGWRAIMSSLKQNVKSFVDIIHLMKSIGGLLFLAGVIFYIKGLFFSKEVRSVNWVLQMPNELSCAIILMILGGFLIAI
jgi:hypothetical protein